MKRSFLSHKKTTVKAGQSVMVDVSGEFVFFAAASDTFLMRFDDDGEWITADNGFEFRKDEGEMFRKVGIQNPTASELEVEFFAGVGRVSRIGQIDNPTFSLDTADKTEIRGAAETLVPTFEILSDAGTPSATYTNFRSITVFNDGFTDILVGGNPLPSKKGVTFAANGRFDLFSSLTVDATGGTALVTLSKP